MQWYSCGFKEAKGLAIKTDKQQKTPLPKKKTKWINQQKNSTELVIIATEGRAGIHWV